MKRFASLFVCFLIINAYSQDISPVGFNKFQLGVNFSSDVCYRTLISNNGSSSANSVIRARNKIEIPKFGYTTGLNIVYSLKKNISFETGLQFSNKGYQTETMDLIYGDQIDPVTGAISPESSDTKTPTKAKYIYSDYYLEIPIKANFTFGKGKVRFTTSAGIAANFFIAETETVVYTYIGGSTKRKDYSSYFNYNIIDLSPTVSLGIDWKITPKISLKAEPTIRYGVLKIIDMPVTGCLWNYGLNVSCYYNL